MAMKLKSKVLLLCLMIALHAHAVDKEKIETLREQLASDLATGDRLFEQGRKKEAFSNYGNAFGRVRDAEDKGEVEKEYVLDLLQSIAKGIIEAQEPTRHGKKLADAMYFKKEVNDILKKYTKKDAAGVPQPGVFEDISEYDLPGYDANVALRVYVALPAFLDYVIKEEAIALKAAFTELLASLNNELSSPEVKVARKALDTVSAFFEKNGWEGIGDRLDKKDLKIYTRAYINLAENYLKLSKFGEAKDALEECSINLYELKVSFDVRNPLQDELKAKRQEIEAAEKAGVKPVVEPEPVVDSDALRDALSGFAEALRGLQEAL